MNKSRRATARRDIGKIRRLRDTVSSLAYMCNRNLISTSSFDNNADL